MLGTMLYLEIQKGKESMKTSEFQQFIRGMSACTRRIIKVNKGCGQISPNDI